MFFRRQRSTSPQWKLVLVSHTHWDREWHLPFQRFRAMLVEAVDSLLDILRKDPTFRHFTLDGQTVLLEDYLEARPEREEELRERISEGRILVGPWYVMPDEFLVSGESLIRNLLEGRRVGSRFGPIMSVGYLPDSFGHISQMPQLLRGFGIDSAILWRGIGSELKNSEVTWEGPDGSGVLLIHMPTGYANAALLPTASDTLMERLQQIRDELESRATTSTLLLMNGDDHMFPQPEIPSVVQEANRRLKDAQIIHGTLPMLLEMVRAEAEANGNGWDVLKGEFRSSETAHLLAGVLSSRINLKQRNVRCESLLERWAEPFSQFASMLPPMEGSRQDDGRRLDASKSLLRVAWRYLLKNHPHDSICGCSIDQVHREMETRFDWAEQIAEQTTDQALRSLAESVETVRSGEGSNSGAAIVFNSEGGPRTDFVVAAVQLPANLDEVTLIGPDDKPVPFQLLAERPSELASATLSRSELQGYLRLAGPGSGWPQWKLRLLEKVIRAALRGRVPDLVVANMDVVPGNDPSTVEIDVEATSGKEHNYETISAGMKQLSSLVDRGDAQLFKVRVSRRDEAEIGFVASQIPPMGLRGYHSGPSRRPQGTAQPLHLENTLENEFVSLQVSPEDGSVRLLDKESGAIYWGLNSFVDGGDAGDEYTYSPPANDTVIQGPASRPAVIWEERGPARQTLRVEMEMRLPASLSSDRSSRSRETVLCPVVTRISVYPHVRRVDFRTKVTNLARDHRLRVHFPTHLQTDHSSAEGQFTVVRRNIEPPVGSSEWVEHPVSSSPQGCFVDLSDGSAGLMIANRGLPEYDVASTETGPCVALTLLRCTGWLSRDDLPVRRGAAGPSLETPGAQMQGSYEFEYSVIPHPGNWESAAQQAYWFANPLRARWTGDHGGSLPLEHSFVSLLPDTLRLSSVKSSERSETDLIVRAYNPTDRDLDAEVRTDFPLEAAEITNLAEDSGEGLPVEPDGSLKFSLPAQKIATIRLTPLRNRRDRVLS